MCMLRASPLSPHRGQRQPGDLQTETKWESSLHRQAEVQVGCSCMQEVERYVKGKLTMSPARDAVNGC